MIIIIISISFDKMLKRGKTLQVKKRQSNLPKLQFMVQNQQPVDPNEQASS